LAESGNMLTMRGRARDQEDWMKDAKLLADVGSSAYKAAQAKDGNALAALAGAVDASCTTCHKQYRPNVYPKEGGSR
jgi:cytochrome c556